MYCIMILILFLGSFNFSYAKIGSNIKPDDISLKLKDISSEKNNKKQFIKSIDFIKTSNELIKQNPIVSKAYEKSSKKTISLFQNASDQGDGEASYILGLLYFIGEVVEKDIEKSKELIQRALDQRLPENYNPDIQSVLNKTIELYKKAAEQNDQEALHYLGVIYLGEEFVEKDIKKAIEFFQKAADRGLAQAQYNLGWLHYRGEGVEKDIKKSIELFQKAADQDDSLALYNLGWLYYQGEGVEKDIKKAIELFQKAADQDDSLALYILGSLYYQGEGVEKDIKKVIELFQKAADQGLAQAQYSLGWFYYLGEDVEKDIERAKNLLQKAAEQGLVQAQNNLAYILEKEEKYQEAFALYHKAAEQNFNFACLNLGYLYQNGLGVKKDEVEASKWFKKGEGELDAWKKARGL